MLAYFSLLISLIKYDMSEERVKLNNLFKIDLTDYYTSPVLDNVFERINQFVNDYKLDDKFKVDKK